MGTKYTFPQCPYFQVTDRELNDLVQEELGLTSYSCWVSEDWGDDGAFPYEISLAAYTAAERGQVAEFLSSEGERGKGTVGLLLSELAARQVIAEGNYLVMLTGF